MYCSSSRLEAETLLTQAAALSRTRALVAPSATSMMATPAAVKCAVTATVLLGATTAVCQRQAETTAWPRVGPVEPRASTAPLQVHVLTASSATLTVGPLAGARRAMTVTATTVDAAPVGCRQRARPIALPCVSLEALPVVAHLIQTKMALSVWTTCSLFWPTTVTPMFRAVAVKTFVHFVLGVVLK